MGLLLRLSPENAMAAYTSSAMALFPLTGRRCTAMRVGFSQVTQAHTAVSRETLFPGAKSAKIRSRRADAR
jgi:hypothetical protein